MERYAEKIRNALPQAVLDIKKESYAAVEGLRAVYALADSEEYLIVDGCKAFQFDGVMHGGPNGVKVCCMNHDNRMIMNKEFAYTAPRAVGRQGASFGCGDRLGTAGAGQLQAVSRAEVIPVLAQQSLRELSLTGRSYDDVMDAAAWAVFKSGYKKGYGADGDHLKNLEEIEAAVNHGVSMITLDCSLVLGDRLESEAQCRALYQNIPKSCRNELEEEYLQKDFGDLGVVFGQRSLERTVVVYKDAVELAQAAYQMLKRSGRQIDLEISLDETDHRTDLKAHYFVANELRRRNVVINSIAPRFVGEFQKAVDYIGEVEAFRANLRGHCRIADYFGHKISIHSGSDKFRVFPVVAEETKGRFHLKTSGTSWLEAVRVIAQTEPALYRDMHKTAAANYRKAGAYYKVDCDLERVKPLEQVRDEELPDYMDQDDARQLLHITYGFMLREDGQLHRRIMEALDRHSGKYREALERHFTRHLSLLGCMKEKTGAEAPGFA